MSRKRKIILGNTSISKIYEGSNNIIKSYIGSTLIFESNEKYTVTFKKYNPNTNELENIADPEILYDTKKVSDTQAYLSLTNNLVNSYYTNYLFDYWTVNGTTYTVENTGSILSAISNIQISTDITIIAYYKIDYCNVNIYDNLITTTTIVNGNLTSSSNITSYINQLIDIRSDDIENTVDNLYYKKKPSTYKVYMVAKLNGTITDCYKTTSELQSMTFNLSLYTSIIIYIATYENIPVYVTVTYRDQNSETNFGSPINVQKGKRYCDLTYPTYPLSPNTNAFMWSPPNSSTIRIVNNTLISRICYFNIDYGITLYNGTTPLKLLIKYVYDEYYYSYGVQALENPTYNITLAAGTSRTYYLKSVQDNYAPANTCFDLYDYYTACTNEVYSSNEYLEVPTNAASKSVAFKLKVPSNAQANSIHTVTITGCTYITAKGDITRFIQAFNNIEITFNITVLESGTGGSD